MELGWLKRGPREPLLVGTVLWLRVVWVPINGPSLAAARRVARGRGGKRALVDGCSQSGG
jgi:hypothetical protein